MQVEPSRR